MNATIKQEQRAKLKTMQKRQSLTGDKGEEEDDEDFQVLRISHQPKSLVGGTLRNYQLEGLNWLFKLYQANLNGILADEMGLGKTIQSIAILCLIESFKTREEKLNRYSHHIVIVPKVTLGKWEREIKEWAPEMRLFKFYGDGEERNNMRPILR